MNFTSPNSFSQRLETLQTPLYKWDVLSYYNIHEHIRNHTVWELLCTMAKGEDQDENYDYLTRTIEDFDKNIIFRTIVLKCWKTGTRLKI